MEENLIKCLKAFATALLSEECFAEDIVEKFLGEAELALHPEKKQELINHIKNLLNQ